MDQLELLRQIYETGLIEVNGREYRLTRMRHKQRRKVFAYFTHIKDQLSDGDFGFMDSEKFDEVMATIADVTTFDGALLSRLETHWDNYPQDYLKFVTAAMGGISYPFLAENLTDSVVSPGVPREKI